MTQMTPSAPVERVAINVPGKAPSALGAYSHAVKAGPLLFLSGQGARDPETGKEAGVVVNPDGTVASYDIAVQTHAVIRNIQTVLAAAGCTLRDVIEVNVYLTDMKDFHAYNQVYAQYFTFEGAPARTTIQAPPPGYNFIEMRVVALCPTPAPSV